MLNASDKYPVSCPPDPGHEVFTKPEDAVARLRSLYDSATDFLRAKYTDPTTSNFSDRRYRAYYPEVRFEATSYENVDSRLAYGHVNEPGEYSATVTRPDIFGHYLEKQIELLIGNHGNPVRVGYSTTSIPLHFALKAQAPSGPRPEPAPEPRSVDRRRARCLSEDTRAQARNLPVSASAAIPRSAPP